MAHATVYDAQDTASGDIKRGDLVWNKNEERSFSNHGWKIYDGHKLVDLDYNIPVGMVPKEFTQDGEFPPTYWMATDKERGLSYYQYIWFNPRSHTTEILNNVSNDDKFDPDKE